VRMRGVAFAGLRHDHIFAFYRQIKDRDDLYVTGAWEEDSDAEKAAKKVIKEPLYPDYESLLADPRVDIVAIGDYYGKRGKLIHRALETGHPVISDKPLCTDLGELQKIAALSAEKALPVGCLLDLREDGCLQRAARLIAEGELGEIRAVHFTAQHPLNYGVRPGWYFEGGKHGGTFNDIAIHGLDAVRWMTGSGYQKTLFARQWNCYAEKEPAFRDSAHFSGLLENGAALTGDVSYAAPSPVGFSLPGYWRFTVWGSRGMLECKAGGRSVLLARAGEKEACEVKPLDSAKRVLEAFLEEVEGGIGKNTESVLKASEDALSLQKYADRFGIKE